MERFRILQPFLAGSLRAQIVGPYVLLMLVVAVIGTLITVRLTVSSTRERFLNELFESARSAGDAVVRLEGVQLDNLRLLTFTEGVPAAVAAHDRERVTARLLPLAANNRLELVTVVDTQGREIVTLLRDLGQETYRQSTSADFSTVGELARVLAGEQDALGDKRVTVLATINGPYLVTIAPVRRAAEGPIVGAILIGTRLQSFAEQLQALRGAAHFSFYDQNGQLWASTLAEAPAVQTAPIDLAATDTRAWTLAGRDYEVATAPLIVRSQALGMIRVALPSDYVVSSEVTSRDAIAILFSLLTLAVVLIGTLLARRIAGPLTRLRQAAMAVTAGDLDQRTGLTAGGEIGDLATAFDTMTGRLAERTAQADALYDEAQARNRQLRELIDRHRAAQQQLIAAEAQAVIGQRAAGIAQDVKGPLSTAAGVVQFVQGDPCLPADLSPHLQTALDQLDRANEILADLARLGHSPTIERTIGDMRPVAAVVERLIASFAREREIAMTVAVAPDPVLASFDAQLIEQALINLTLEAVATLDPGSQLTVRVDPEGAEACLRIQTWPPTWPATGEGASNAVRVAHTILEPHGGRLATSTGVVCLLLPGLATVPDALGHVPVAAVASTPAQMPC
jgi:HAMP domain-containing protein